MKDAIQEQKIGKVSPIAFSPFDSTQEPDPKYGTVKLLRRFLEVAQLQQEEAQR